MTPLEHVHRTLRRQPLPPDLIWGPPPTEILIPRRVLVVHELDLANHEFHGVGPVTPDGLDFTIHAMLLSTADPEVIGVADTLSDALAIARWLREHGAMMVHVQQSVSFWSATPMSVRGVQSPQEVRHGTK